MIVFLTKAAPFSASIDPETGVVSNAQIRTDSNASGGSYVQFGGAAAPSFQPTAPYYATFFYPWYKNTSTDGTYSYWQDNGNNPPSTWFSHYLPDTDTGTFSPANELYSSNDYNTFKWQLSKLSEAKQEVAIGSWFGQGSKQDTALKTYLNDFMKRSDNPYPNLRWALYYECEGIGTSGSPNCPSATATPTVAQLVADLQYIKDNLSGSPYFLKVNNKPVIFVYGENEDASTLTRWSDANSQAGNAFYIVQKVFSGYATASPQPDSWHQYAPASSYGTHGTHASFVSPGFWKDVTDPVDGAVRLGRDINRFQADVSKMVSDAVTWKLVETWNEWGEGTSVEPGTQTMIDGTGKEVADPNAPAFGNSYVQALADRLPALEQGAGEPIANNESFVFASGGDIGANSSTDASYAKLDTSGADYFLALGDLDYDETASDEAWCSYTKSKLPTLFSNPAYPFELLTGNHEEEGGPDGYVLNHAACLPDGFNSVGFYPVQYYFDYPANKPLMRVINISANLKVNEEVYNYTNGTSYTAWLTAAIDDARAKGIPWVNVNMHKNCISAGVKTCEISEDLTNLLIAKKVDFVLQGHEHNYQRTQQLSHGTGCTRVLSTSYDADCVVQRSDPNIYKSGSGTMFVIDGIVGRSATNYQISTSDPSYPYMVKAVSNGADRGFVKWTVTASRIDAQFIASAGTLTDTFSFIK